MSWKTTSFVRRVRGDQRGQVAVLAGIAIVALIGFTAIVVDVVYLLQDYEMLQAATNAAALSGAEDINCCIGTPGKAITTATSYSAVTGNINAKPTLTVTMVSGYPKLKCLTSTGVSCTGPDSANAIVVMQQATVQMYLLVCSASRPVTMSATATAGSQGGVGHPADVEIIIDTTVSMNSADASCSISGATRLGCALAGVRALLSGFSSSTAAHVGLMVFPGLTAATKSQRNTTATAALRVSRRTSKRALPPSIRIISLASDYQTGPQCSTPAPTW